MKILTLDMGTSSTRLALHYNSVFDEIRGDFGARYSLFNGKEALYLKLNEMITALLKRNNITESNVEYIIASGMATSEMGLYEVSHKPITADIYTVSKDLKEKLIPEITAIPFLFVAGLKDEADGKLVDVMRGEETEVFGLLSELSVSGEAVFVLAGTHNKIIYINENSEIAAFKTTMSGELLDSVISNTILKNSVSHDFKLSEAYVIKGAKKAKENGLTAALFETRVMMMNGVERDLLSSFVYGAVLSEDIPAISTLAKGKKIYISGRENLKAVYSILLDGERVTSVDKSITNNATHNGLKKIYSIYKVFEHRDDVLRAIEAEKVIAIVRAPDPTTFETAVRAMHEGGIRLIEVTFDRSGKIPKEETARLISLLCENFGNDMYIGAGTVTTADDVMLAYNAGAKFIISPNCDEQIIRLTRKLGLISIPAALTPTEIVAAISYGADFIKLFPADAFGKGYIKAIKAPISDAKILAVGGVTPENARSYIEAGFSGIGVGSNLYNSKLIAEGKFDEIKETAEKYVNMVK